MKNKGLLFFTALVIFLGFQSCKVGRSYKGSEVEMPVVFEDGDSSITLNTDSLQSFVVDGPAWWKLFEDKLLDTLVSKALKHNYSLLSAAENILQARRSLGMNKKDLLPQFGYGLQFASGNTLGGFVGPEQDFLFGGLTASWEIDIWGKLRRRNEAARNRLLASEYGYRSMQLSLVTTVMDAYFFHLESKELLEIAQRNTALRDSMLIIIQARFDKGIVPAIDLDQAKIQYAIAAESVPMFERAVAQSAYAIFVLIGEMPQSLSTQISMSELQPKLELPERLPLELLNRRPDVIEKERLLVAANADVGAAQGDRLPTLSLSGSFGTGTNDLGDLNFTDPLWQVGAGLAGPLFYWNQLKQRVDIEKSQREQARIAYQLSVLNAVKEVKDQSVALSTFDQQIQLLEERVEAALHAQKLSQARYSQGVTSYLEYLESQRQAFDAERALTRVKSQKLSAYVALYKALGGGWLDEQERNNQEGNSQ